MDIVQEYFIANQVVKVMQFVLEQTKLDFANQTVQITRYVKRKVRNQLHQSILENY